MRELGSAYEEVRGRIKGLAGDLDQERATIPVPACPGWSIQDVVAHLTGLCADILSGNLDGSAGDQWTAAQVESRREWKIGDVLAEWDDVGLKIAMMLDDFPGSVGQMLVADLTVHEHDIRGALGQPGERNSQGVAIGNDFLVGMIGHTGACVSGVGPLDVNAGDRSWIVGTGEVLPGDQDTWLGIVTAGGGAPEPDRPPVASVSTEPFDLLRAITGRRSAEQIRSFGWTTDPEPFLSIFGYGPFTIRPTDLEE